MPLIALFLVASPALACSIVGPSELVVDPELSDGIAPDVPVLGDVLITRGRGPRKTAGGVSTSTSCDDLGFITIEVDETKPDVGFVLELLDGELPEGLDALPEQPWLGPDLTLTWIDEALDDQDAFAFTLAISAVDSGGDRSEAVEIDISDDGIPDEEEVQKGCSTVAGSATGSWTLLLGLTLVARRRRIRR